MAEKTNKGFTVEPGQMTGFNESGKVNGKINVKGMEIPEHGHIVAALWGRKSEGGKPWFSGKVELMNEGAEKAMKESTFVIGAGHMTAHPNQFKEEDKHPDVKATINLSGVSIPESGMLKYTLTEKKSKGGSPWWQGEVQPDGVIPEPVEGGQGGFNQ
jgi:hypothetical protein